MPPADINKIVLANECTHKSNLKCKNVKNVKVYF